MISESVFVGPELCFLGIELRFKMQRMRPVFGRRNAEFAVVTSYELQYLTPNILDSMHSSFLVLLFVVLIGAGWLFGNRSISPVRAEF